MAVWDPYTAFGEPMLANAGRQILYPTTWLTLLAPLTLVFTLFVVAHVFLTGWGCHGSPDTGPSPRWPQCAPVALHDVRTSCCLS